MDIGKVANNAEMVIHERLANEASNPYELEGSMLFGLTTSANGLVITADCLGTHPDVYDLLDTATDLSGYSFAVVVTTGWAAPLNADGEAEGAPSKHPKRRRVRLMVTANRESVASVLRFEDEPEVTITDLGDATGTLNDAIRDFVTANF